MTGKKVAATIDDVRQWADELLCDEPQDPGHLLLRHMMLWSVLSPAPEPTKVFHPTASPDGPAGTWFTLPRDAIPLFEVPGEKRGKYDDKKGARLVQRALHGDVDADAALCAVAFQFILVGRRMPRHLLEYILHVLRDRFETPGPRRRGGDKYANLTRNVFIVGAVSRLENRGFRPTRNRETRTDPQESGCSIVAKALERIGIHISESGVEEVWRNREALSPSGAHRAVRD